MKTVDSILDASKDASKDASIDSFGRKINYLRMSITDLCNLRCVYCMPEEGVAKQEHRDILSIEELIEVGKTAVELGMDKIRISGGEPLVRKGFLTLCRELSALEGLRELAVTTNGILLSDMAEDMKKAGVTRVNISLDTLDREKFRKITRLGNIDDVLKGMEAAMETGLNPVKINTVLIGGFNDDEIGALAELTMDRDIEVRFIELMPIGDIHTFGDNAYIPNTVVLDKLGTLERLEDGAVAKRYRLPGARGSIGLISPLSDCFCSQCNRIRLTADGYVKPCLHSHEEINIRGLKGEELKEMMKKAILSKPGEHGLLSSSSRSDAGRNMNQIGG